MARRWLLELLAGLLSCLMPIIVFGKIRNEEELTMEKILERLRRIKGGDDID